MGMRRFGRHLAVPLWRSAGQASLQYNVTPAAPASSHLYDRHYASSSTAPSAAPTASTSSTDFSANTDGFSFFPPTAKKESVSKKDDQHSRFKALFTEIYSANRPPSADRTWEAYLAFKRGAEAESTESDQLTDSVRPELTHINYQHLLRAIDPDVRRRRAVESVGDKINAANTALSSWLARGGGPADSIISYPYRTNMPSLKLGNQRHVREYLRRVRILFRDMRLYSHQQKPTSTSGDPTLVPDLSDYDHVLSRLARGGNITPMLSLWKELLQQSKTRPSLKPKGRTYHQLMVGIARHANIQILRMQKAEAMRTYKRSDHAMWSIKAVPAATRAVAEEGEILAPTARAAAALWGIRAMVLLREMREQGIETNQITFDWAARAVRLAGHLDGLCMLLRQTYGIDLEAPDNRLAADTASSLSGPSVHLLNTILMTLGEQATVPDMITAYETLAKPLPLPTNPDPAGASGEQDGGGGMFATAFADTLQSWRRRAVEDDISIADGATGSLPAVFPYQSPYQIHPNSKTFQILIRHCCHKVDPIRSPVPLRLDGFSGTATTLAMISTEMAIADVEPGGARRDDMQKREHGDYTLFARALVVEALERSHTILYRLARNLGIDISHISGQDSPEAWAQISFDADADYQKKTAGSRAADFAKTQLFRAKLQTKAEPLYSSSAAHSARPEHNVFDIVPNKAYEPDFLPALEPVWFSVTVHMLTSFYSNRMGRESIGGVQWLQKAASKALELKLAESKVLVAAHSIYAARLQRTARQSPSIMEEPEVNIKSDHANWTADEAEDEDMSAELPPFKLVSQKPAKVMEFLNYLEAQKRTADKQAQSLQSFLYDRLYPQLDHLRTRRQMTKRLQHLNRVEAHLREQHDALTSEQWEYERRQRVAEERRARQQYAQEESVDLDAEHPTLMQRGVHS